MKLVILITAKTDQTLEIATAWQQAGATGVTILEGYGLRRLQEKMEIRDDLPFLPSLTALMRGKEVETHLLISVVDAALAETLHQTTVGIVGDLTLPGNGIILTIDIASMAGLRVN
jgi:hypothetical protein